LLEPRSSLCARDESPLLPQTPQVIQIPETGNAPAPLADRLTPSERALILILSGADTGSRDRYRVHMHLAQRPHDNQNALS